MGMNGVRDHDTIRLKAMPGSIVKNGHGQEMVVKSVGLKYYIVDNLTLGEKDNMVLISSVVDTGKKVPLAGV